MEPVITTISIDGNVLSTFESIRLEQTINDHHRFELVVDQDSIEEFQAHNIEKSKQWLGKSLVVVFEEHEFLGVITNIRLSQSEGFYGKLILTGYSKTILLEGGKHIQSWLNKGLGKILKDVVGQAGIAAEIKPKYTAPYEYQAQYRESHFQFIKRLAHQHNEWLYYDGTKLIFGKPSPASPIELRYGVNISEISISMDAVPTKQSVFSYHPLEDAHYDSVSKDVVGGLSELGEFAFNTSKDLYPIVPNGFSSPRVSDKSEIDEFIKGQQSSAASRSSVLTATSTHPDLSVGAVIKVEALGVRNGEKETKSYGEFIITSITHNASGLEEYSNTFEAVSSGVSYLEPPKVEMPFAQAQIATVVSNEDPDQKGRVEVQFQWQSGDMKTSWIRVMTPDGGSSDKVGTNRGFLFIPEKDDQVMVGFRYNDPNRPFVMGSLFSGTTGAGGSDGNKIKSITTRSGSTIVFDDDDNDGSITITDAASNSVSLDGTGVISVTANDQISLSTGSSSLTMKSDGEITLQGENIIISAKTKATMESQGEVVINGAKGATMDSPKLATVSSAKEVNITGTAKTIVSSSASTEIQGTIIKLN